MSMSKLTKMDYFNKIEERMFCSSSESVQYRFMKYIRCIEKICGPLQLIEINKIKNNKNVSELDIRQLFIFIKN